MMKMLRALVVAFVAIPALAITATAGDEVHIKDFTLPSAMDGSLIHLADYSGKVILINFWRTECAYSRDEAPRLAELYKKYHSQGLEILGISDDHPNTIKDIPAYVSRYGITWRIGLNDEGEFRRDVFKGPGTPWNYLVSRSGVVTFLGKDWDGDIHKIEDPIAKALAEPTPASAPLTPRVSNRPPEFELPDLAGKTVRSKDFAGKPMVVAFFDASSCARNGKELSALNDQYASKGLAVIGIDTVDQPQAAKQSCADKYAIHFPVLHGDKKIQQAWLGGDRHWGVFFINRDGESIKEILNWEDDDLEHWTWPKYAEYLLTTPENKTHTLNIVVPPPKATVDAHSQASS